MKAITLSNRLAKRFNGSKTSKSYQVVKDLINNENKTYMLNDKRIRPVYVSGSKRFASNQDHTLQITSLLDLLGIKYEKGNDASRGGLTGNFIDIKTKIEY